VNQSLKRFRIESALLVIAPVQSDNLRGIS